MVLGLQQLGYHCLPTSSAALALDLLAHEKVDVVLSDLRMAGQDGIEMIGRLHRGDAGHLNQHVPVIMITADPTPETRRRCHEAGIKMVLTKPIAVAELAAAVESACRKDRA